MFTNNPTRSELKNLVRKLAIAKKGYKMLKDKNDEMVKIFSSRIKTCKRLRKEVEQEFFDLIKQYIFSRQGVSSSDIEKEFNKTLYVDVKTENLFNICLKDFCINNKNDSKEISLNQPLLDILGQNLRNFMPKLLKLAGLEDEIFKLGREIESTKRRVNALNENLIPNLQKNISYISFKLEENERASQVRLLKYKQMN